MSFSVQSLAAASVSAAPQGYVRGHQQGPANRVSHFSNVGQGDKQPGRHQDPKAARVHQYASEQMAGRQTDDARRKEERKARWDAKNKAQVQQSAQRIAPPSAQPGEMSLQYQPREMNLQYVTAMVQNRQ